jgi:hypothetical protein
MWQMKTVSSDARRAGGGPCKLGIGRHLIAAYALE